MKGVSVLASGNCYGLHRVIEPAGSLPQPALKVDNSLPIWDNEILIDVEVLNITATAFTRIEEEAGGDPAKISAEVMKIVSDRGKFQCPVTGSGGMLIGRVGKIGPDLVGRVDLAEGDAIATLVSLSLTPLHISEIKRVDVQKDQVYVTGHAILFESGIYCRLPGDIPRVLALAVLDVCGAPGHAAKLIKAGDNIVVVGAGKAGILCLNEAVKRARPTGRVLAVEYDPVQCEAVKKLGLADAVLCADATRPVDIMNWVQQQTRGKMADITINTVNVANTEMTSILSTREHGTVLFFSMSTSFSKAALGAEGAGKVVNMLIGTGYTEGHVEIALQALRENRALRDYFESLYSE